MSRRKLLLLACLALTALAAAYGPGPLFTSLRGLLREAVPEPAPPGPAGPPRGRVVFSSNRGGGHDLYLLSLPEMAVTRLTEGGRGDTFPRFSPDGRRLVFARGAVPGAAERDLDAWEVWLMDLATGRETRVGAGCYPQWVGGDRVSFLRDARVVVRRLADGGERVVFDGRGPPLFGLPVGPELSPDQRMLCFTARGGRLAGVVVWGLVGGGLARPGYGCEITWLGDDRVVWVENAGRGKTRLAVSPAARPEPSPFMDLPGDHSHEYFPRPSRDGRWLVWAASAAGHDHDAADYELFLWRVGRPAAEALRLTHDPANDRWPDLHLAQPDGS